MSCDSVLLSANKTDRTDISFTETLKLILESQLVQQANISGVWVVVHTTCSGISLISLHLQCDLWGMHTHSHKTRGQRHGWYSLRGQLLGEQTRQLTKVKRFLAICLSMPGKVGLNTSVTLLGQRLYAMSVSRLLRNCTWKGGSRMTAVDVLHKW